MANSLPEQQALLDTARGFYGRMMPNGILRVTVQKGKYDNIICFNPRSTCLKDATSGTEGRYTEKNGYERHMIEFKNGIPAMA